MYTRSWSETLFLQFQFGFEGLACRIVYQYDRIIVVLDVSCHQQFFRECFFVTFGSNSLDIHTSASFRDKLSKLSVTVVAGRSFIIGPGSASSSLINASLFVKDVHLPTR